MGVFSNTIYHGDCREVMPTLDAVDSIVTDPPYGLHFMGKTWDKFGGPTGRDNTTHSKRGGAMHAGLYDHRLNPEFQDFMTEAWIAALRVAKPGAHLLAFGGTRTFHRLAVAIEDAGWEIRDTIMWVYGSGFPKSLDVGKAIDKAAGAEREVGIEGRYSARRPREDVKAVNAYHDGVGDYASSLFTAPATPEAVQWDGWGTALKPAWEPIIVARKPLRGTVATNVLKYGTGGINIDGCRIEGQPGRPGNLHDGVIPKGDTIGRLGNAAGASYSRRLDQGEIIGRWPANLIHDGSEEVVSLFPETETNAGTYRNDGTAGMFGAARPAFTTTSAGDCGSAARFFYCAKTSREDREEGLSLLPVRTAGEATDRVDGSAGLNSPRAGASRTDGARNHHPTVKPTSLMRYLCRLVTPPGGIILDPFCGSGSTGKAAILEGFRFVGIELEAEYIPIAEARLAWAARRGHQGALV